MELVTHDLYNAPQPLRLPSASCIPAFDNHYLPLLIKLINNSSCTIDVCSYYWRLNKKKKHDPGTEVVEAVIRASWRGVTVRVLLNNFKPMSNIARHNRITAEALGMKNIDVRFCSSKRLSHAKVWIFDSQVVVLGSHNITKAASQTSSEVSLAISSKVLVRRFNEFFMGLYGQSR